MTRQEAKNFSRQIETFAANNNMLLIDAIVEHCENNRIDLELAAKMLTPKIKKKIKEQALGRNQLKQKKTNGLPI